MDNAQHQLVQGYLAKARDYDALSWIDEETANRAVREAEEFVGAVAGYIATLEGK